MTRYYDPKRYRIAPWRGRYGDQAHSLRLHPHVEKILQQIDLKKKQLARLLEQIRQLEELEKRARGTVIDGILVREISGPPEDNPWYKVALVSDHERRSAEVYPNAHNGGKTFGLRIFMDGYPYSKDEWRGAGHTLKQATDGARAWVLRKERQEPRYKDKE